MDYQFLDELLLKHYSSTIVELNALRPNSALYSILILQPCGVVDANEGFIGNKDRPTACAKHRSFLDLVQDESVDLAITPEYSCPWDSVQDAIERQCLPDRGKLWVLGCESITPSALQGIVEKSPDVCWIYEPVREKLAHTLLDPVCYILNAEDQHGRVHPVIAVQFKTQHMADHSAYLERDHFIMGTTRYILRNDADSVHLTALVCSEALTFSLDELEQHSKASYFLLHLQLNRKPYQATFVKYRDDAFQWGADNHEVLCVNWARGFCIGKQGEPSSFGASALFTKSTELSLHDEIVNTNHRMGLYYTRWDSHRSHIYLFNYSEQAFCFQTTKPSQTANPAVLRRRTGPLMVMVFGWDEDESKWLASESLGDGFSTLCEEIGAEADLSPLHDEQMLPIDRERLLALTSGAIPPCKDWYTVEKLPCFSARQDQKIQRMTVVQDPGDSEFDDLHAERYRRIHNFSYLRNHILPQPGLFPDCIADLAGDVTVRYPLAPRQYNVNVCTSDCRNAATLAFLGVAPEKKARVVFDTMADILGDAQRRLVVWYQHGESVKAIYSPTPRIDDDLTESCRSILKVE